MLFIYLSFYRSNKISRYQDIKISRYQYIDRSITRSISLKISMSISITVYLSISIALFPNMEIYSLKQTPTDCLCNACKYLATTAYTDTDAPVDVFLIQVSDTTERSIRARVTVYMSLYRAIRNHIHLCSMRLRTMLFYVLKRSWQRLHACLLDWLRVVHSALAFNQ